MHMNSLLTAHMHFVTFLIIFFTVLPLVHDGSNIRPIDNAQFCSFQSSSSNTSSFDAFNLRAIDGVMVLPVCPRVVSRVINSGSAPQTFRDVSHFRYKYCNCSPVVYLIDNFYGFRHVLDKGYKLTATRVFEDGCGTLTDIQYVPPTESSPAHVTKCRLRHEVLA